MFTLETFCVHHGDTWATVALLGLFASPISGASMGPARSLGPDIVANHYTGPRSHPRRVTRAPPWRLDACG